MHVVEESNNRLKGEGRQVGHLDLWVKDENRFMVSLTVDSLNTGRVHSQLHVQLQHSEAENKIV